MEVCDLMGHIWIFPLLGLKFKKDEGEKVRSLTKPLHDLHMDMHHLLTPVVISALCSTVHKALQKRRAEFETGLNTASQEKLSESKEPEKTIPDCVDDMRRGYSIPSPYHNLFQ